MKKKTALAITNSAMPAASIHAVFVMMIYVGPAAQPQAAPIAPESRRVVEGKILICYGGGEAGRWKRATTLGKRTKFNGD